MSDLDDLHTDAHPLAEPLEDLPQVYINGFHYFQRPCDALLMGLQDQVPMVIVRLSHECMKTMVHQILEAQQQLERQLDTTFLTGPLVVKLMQADTDTEER